MTNLHENIVANDNKTIEVVLGSKNVLGSRSVYAVRIPGSEHLTVDTLKTNKLLRETLIQVSMVYAL